VWRAALPVALAFLSLFLGQATAAEPRPPVAMFIVDHMTFEQFMAVPEFRALARAGGAGLMTAVAPEGDLGPGAYLTLGTGARSAVPFGVVKAPPIPVGLRVTEMQQIINANREVSVPGLLGSLLLDRGIRPCMDTGRAILVVMDRNGVGRAGPRPRGFGLVGGTGRPCPFNVFTEVGAGPRLAGSQIRQITEALYSGPVRVIVLEARPSYEMKRAGDLAAPIVIAEAVPSELFSSPGPMHTLTSDTTRIDGLVSNEDVAPTILSFFGIPVPDKMNGTPIRRTDSPPPFDLHRGFLDSHRIMTLVQTIAFGLAIGPMLLGLALLWLPRLPSWVGGGLMLLGLVGFGMQVALLPASWLPTFDLWMVMGTLAAMGVVLAALSLVLARGHPRRQLALVGTVAMVLIALDAALGWRSLPTPLLGGSALEGERFFGLGNSYAGVLMSGVVLSAALLAPMAGVGLLVAASLFAALPFAGADIGGGVTLLMLAAIWFLLRSGDRLEVRRIASVAAVAVAGVAVLIVLNRFAPSPTHVTRALEDSHGPLGLLSLLGGRLADNIRATADAPGMWAALIAVPLFLAAVITRVGPFRQSLEAHPAWRDACVLLGVGGILGYLLNDTFGMAEMSFVYLAPALIYPTVLDRLREGRRAPRSGML
jgi:hypothetical protein